MLTGTSFLIWAPIYLKDFKSYFLVLVRGIVIPILCSVIRIGRIYEVGYMDW